MKAVELSYSRANIKELATELDVLPELIYRFKYINRRSAALSIFEYIETWYNTLRRHSSLDYLSPLEYGKVLNSKRIAA